MSLGDRDQKELDKYYKRAEKDAFLRGKWGDEIKDKTCGCIFANIEYELEGVKYCSHCLIDKLDELNIIEKIEKLDGINLIKRYSWVTLDWR